MAHGDRRDPFAVRTGAIQRWAKSILLPAVLAAALLIGFGLVVDAAAVWAILLAMAIVVAARVSRPFLVERWSRQPP